MLPNGCGEVGIVKRIGRGVAILVIIMQVKSSEVHDKFIYPEDVCSPSVGFVYDSSSNTARPSLPDNSVLILKGVS